MLSVLKSVVGIDCPPGLEPLKLMDQIFIKQKMEVLEVITGWETCNKYKILNKSGQLIFTAKEVPEGCMGFCCRMSCGSARSFHIIVFDLQNREVMSIRRDYACCLQTVNVEAPIQTPIGSIKQACTFCIPKYDIRNANSETVLKIKGPCCTSSCFGNVNFKVLSADGVHEVGMVSKQWSGIAKEYFTDADNFGIKFPIDLSVKCKATLIGACFLIDFMYFEDNQQNSARTPF